MAGMVTGNSEALIRSNVWTTQLKDVLYADLQAQSLVRWLTDFPDGNTLNVPSIGQMYANDYVEDQAVQYTPLATGNFQFTISEYISSATYITNKDKQDSFVMSQLVSMFVPKEARAIAERVEVDIMKQGQPGTPGGQTVANANTINGAAHRLVGSTVVNTKQTVGIRDFALAAFALKKANVPQQAFVAIVDPSVEFYLNTLTNLVSAQNNPMFDGVVTTGFGSSMRFIRNIMGFDVYTSNYLPLCGTNQTGTSETINSVASGANAVCNLFFSAAPDVTPWIGAWRQMPNVDGDYNKDFQREEFVTTARYGLKLFRPENFVTILSDPSAVA